MKTRDRQTDRDRERERDRDRDRETEIQRQTFNATVLLGFNIPRQGDQTGQYILDMFKY